MPQATYECRAFGANHIPRAMPHCYAPKLASRDRKWRSNVPKDNRIVILTGLIATGRRIGAAPRRKAISSNIAYPGCLPEEEPLNGNHIKCIDRGVAVHVSSQQPASRERSSEIEEMPLHGEHIDGVDACRGREARRLAWRKCIGHTRKTRQRVVAVLVGRGRAIPPTTRNSPRYRYICQGDTRRACRRALAYGARYVKERARCWRRCRRCWGLED